MYADHGESIKIHNPESLEKVPINTFHDVLQHHSKLKVVETDEYRVRHLKLKYTIEKFLEIGVKVEKKRKIIL